MNHRIVECPGCLAKLKLRQTTVTIEVDCPRCGEQIVVVGAPAEPSSRGSGTATRSTRSSVAGSQSRTGSGTPAGARSPSASRSTRPAAAGSRTRRSNSTPDSDSDYDEFESTYSGNDQLPPRRSSRTRTMSAEDMRAQRENRIFLGILGVGAVVLVAVGVMAASWLMNRGDSPAEGLASNSPPVSTPSDSVASVAGTNPSSTPTPNSNPTPNPTPAGPQNSGSGFPGPPVNPGLANVSPPDLSPPDLSPPDLSLPVVPPPVSGGCDVNPAGVAPQQPPAAAIPVVSSDGRRLRYHWKPGDEHVYQVSISAGSGNDVYRVNGTCNYSVRADTGQADDQESTGSGFVVSADGVIATCAHVVEGARQIDVQLQGQSWPATVIATDPRADVALLRINATGLPVLQLRDSDSAQMAEYVRVVGFPLSDVLGTGVKVTTGTISGIVNDPQRGPRIQVDAPINPGNSGGPVVNEAGQVIGIASAKLAGATVTSVGFVSPANQLRALMTANRIQSSAEAAGPALAGPALAGPEIARRVTPSVVYIKVKGSIGGPLASVAYNASFTETQPFNPDRMRFGAFPRMPSHTSDRGTIRVNAMGDILEYSGEEHLPFVLGPVGLFFIERLSSFSETSWQHEEESTLNRIKRADRGPLGRGFGPPRGFGPRPGFGRPPGIGGDPFNRGQEDEVLDRIPAIERISYTADRELNGRISLRKTYEFTTTRNPERPYMKIRGNGTVVFDLNSWMPHSLEYDATLESNDEDGNSRFPIRVTYTLRNPEEVRRERDAAQQKHQEMQEEKERTRTTPDPQLVDSLLEDIRKAEGGLGASGIFERLAEMAIVEEKRENVLRVARKHLKNSNAFVVKSAAQAFAHWATVKEFDELVGILENKDGMMFSAHQKVVRTMAGFNDPRVYPILIEALNHSFVVDAAKKAMIEVGEPMEDLILKQFGSISDGRVKRELLTVLKSVGTEKSESFLEKLATGPDFALRRVAQQALDAIRAR